jgi:signal transduction histidine kinase
MRGVSAALQLLLVAGLIGVLCFLYVKTQTADFSKHNEEISRLRELERIDSQWNADVLRSRFDLSGTTKIATQQARLTDTLNNLSSDANILGSKLLDTGVPALAIDFNEKLAVIERYDAQNKTIKAALASALATEVPLVLQVREAQLGGRLRALLADTLRYVALPEPNGASAVEAMAAVIYAGDATRSADVRDPVRNFVGNLLTVVRQKPIEVSLLTKVVDNAAGARANTLASAVDREFQALVQEKELFRVYLIAYAGALLVFLLYMEWRLRHSMAQVDDANRALRAANTNLEQRVTERTRELTRAMEELKESETMLVQSEKMSSLGQMVAGIAHEINTPLAYVKSSLESIESSLPGVTQLLEEFERLLLMLNQGSDEAAVNAQFSRVTTMAEAYRAQEVADDLSRLIKDGVYGINQIHEIITNLKNFSRIDRSHVTSFDVNDGVESTLLMAKHLVKHRRVVKDLGAVQRISCSPSQVNQVLLNLITNAAQATADGTGTITIKTAMVDKAHVQIDVEDNGRGIPDTVLPKIFDPFFTTKEVGKGTGLGLAIAYKIVEQHGGSIQVASRVGIGTRFSVVLPVEPPAAYAA